MVYDLIIIGGGPGGITAAIYAARQRMNTLIITKEFGGQMSKKATEVCNYPGYPRITGPELIAKFLEHLDAQECVSKKMAEVEKVKKKNEIFEVLTNEGEKFSGKAVIISTGSEPRMLEVPGEKEFMGKGVSYCVTCDGPIFKGKIIAVVGGGNAGFEAALFMANYGKKIYILERGEKSMADKKNQDEAAATGKIELITNAQVKEIKGEKFVKALVYEHGPEKILKTLEVQGIFVEIGSQPAAGMAMGLVDFTVKGEIKVEIETFQTKTPGLYAAGDVNQGKYKQIVTAAGEGCKAALAAYEYIKSQK